MPYITRIVDLQTRRARPVEEFERPIKGDADEAREVQGQRYLVLYLLLTASILLAWLTSQALQGGAQ